MSDDERTLADESVETQIRDVSDPEAMTPEGFSFASFVAGARATRRAVTLYARGDLLAERDLIQARIREAQDQGKAREEIDALRERLADVVDEMTAPGNTIDVVVEGRAPDATDRLLEALKKDGVEDGEEITLRLVASQVVAPEGITYELLEQFRRVSQPQVNLLVAAATQANQQAPGVMPDFSRGASVSRRMRASS